MNFLMFETILDQIKKIFVGRTAELARLQVYWKMAQESGEHMVHVLLNAPGIGKTALIRQFGQNVENKKDGLFFDYLCQMDYDSPSRLNQHLVETIQIVLQEKETLIFNILENDQHGLEKRTRLDKLDD